MKIFRGTGNERDIRDNKNIGTYYTSSIEEAQFYGNDIDEIEIKGSDFIEYGQDDLDKMVEDWLLDLEEEDPQEYEFQVQTKAYFTEQRGEILAANDAKDRGYSGIILRDIPGEAVETTDYIVIF